jgi:hypothetical protein
MLKTLRISESDITWATQVLSYKKLRFKHARAVLV